ncbi:ribonuclease R [Seleniivibrio woodruffii]|uniref:ribonuclease R n=1 Tax=Seleniivibrio woodruffii TaxID=1078050 RepID=UPI0039E3F198
MSRILKTIKSAGKPLTFKQILSMTQEDPKQLKQELKELTRKRKVRANRNGTYSVPSEKAESKTLTGKMDLHPDGYGFMSVDGGGRDLFIPRNKMGGALHGDRVRVSVETFRGKPEGKVLEITERSVQQIIGRAENLAGILRVVPMTKKFNSYIYVSAASAKGIENDDIVMVELTSYPDGQKAGRGIIKKRLGKLTDPRIEDLIVLNRYNIEREYPQAVEEYVKSIAPKLLKEAGKRTDFRDLTTVTIDGETARDFDDAISVNVTDTGYELYVHIADVSHFVHPDTPVDKEAFSRGTSFYFPEFAVPMLPEMLSNNLCSLRPDEEKFTLSAKITYDEKAQRKRTDLYRSIIKSNRRLTYTYVQAVLDETEKEQDKEILRLLKDSERLALLIMKRRKKEGMLDFDFPETEFDLDENGEVTAVRPSERHLSHRIIEHFMIEANEVVSEFLEKHVQKSVYRIHDKPDPLKLNDFSQLAESFGIAVTIKDVTPKEVARASEAVGKSPYGDILGPALVRTMAKAEYNTNNIGHFGLASESYTHFTSPIRRYPDLMVHRLICNRLFNAHYEVTTDLDTACQKSTENEQRAENAERDIERFKKVKYLMKHMDEPFAAIITSVGPFGLSIYLPTLMMKGTITLEAIQGDVYQYIKKAQLVKGKRTGVMYRAADPIEVMAERIDYDIQEAYFYPL